MSRYGQYGYYDPVGSSQPQPTGYTYQSSSPPSYPSAALFSAHGSSHQQNSGNHACSTQPLAGNAESSKPNPTDRTAATLSSLGNQQDYGQTSSRNSSGQNANNRWFGSNVGSGYASSNLQPPSQSQANNSPLYNTSTQTSTGGRLSVPDQVQSASENGASSSYRNALSNLGRNHNSQSSTAQSLPHPPQRYNSPLQAVQAQQHSHQKQMSRGSDAQPSPQVANAVQYAQGGRQSSASVEPSPTTVDPSQVYDNRAEVESKLRHQAERRKKIEPEQAARKADEDRLAAEKNEAEKAKRQAADEADVANGKKQQDREKEARRKARGEKRPSKSADAALQQMAPMSPEGSGAAADDDEEAEMRALFRKMREFNSKNPAMLAKLWEEERKQHADSQSLPAQRPTPAPVAKTAHSRQSAAQSHSSPQANPSRSAAASSSASLWPPHKKGALADATAKWLMGLPENVGKSVSQQAVLDILNLNPSYVQLCESLEELGMKFERSTLARELLKAVPDGLRTQPKPSNPVTSTKGTSTLATATTKDPCLISSSESQRASSPNLSRGSNTVAYSTPRSLSDAAREVNQMHKSTFHHGGAVQHPQQGPYSNQSQTTANGSRPQSQARSDSQSTPPEVTSELRPQEPPRSPADKEEAARKRTFADLVDLTKGDESDGDGPPSKKTSQMPTSDVVPFNAPSAQHRDLLAYPQQHPHPNDQHLLKPYQYQPKAKGQFGSGLMNPPQQPNAIVPSNQQPAEAAQPLSKAPGPNAESLQQSRMRGRMLVEPIMRDRVARKSRYNSNTIARDVLLATGRHPDMRGLNQHLNSMQKLLGQHGGETDTTGTKCDLSTIRWEIIDPEPSKEEETAATTVSPSRDPSAEVSRRPIAPYSTTVDYEAPFSSASLPAKPKRGRPRLSDSVRVLGNRASPTASTPAPVTASPSSKKAPHSPAEPTLLAQANGMAAIGTPVGYSAFRQIGPDGQVIKKKGRPVGWRKNVHSREAQGLPPQYPKKIASRQEPSLVEPQWQSFRCEWKGCKAELQNLDTLKKHLFKVHGREMEGGRGYQCLWKACDRQPGEGGRFDELEEWFGHVDTQHLQPVAWRQGDGPTGGSLGGE